MTTPASIGVPAIHMTDVTTGCLRDPHVVTAEQVDWTVQPGDFWVIAGLQGTGKSDFLMTAAGLMAPVSGHYELFGQSMPIFEESRLAERLRLGLVFDGGQLFNHLTVWENIALPLRYHQNLTRAEAAEPVQRMLEWMELEEFADRTPGALGRNWVRRAALGRALMLAPELLLLDNPLGGLDYRNTSWWLGFLDQLARGHELAGRRPMSLVVTTADLRPWKGRARQFAILRNRRLAVLGTWEQVEAASAELRQELLPFEAGDG